MCIEVVVTARPFATFSQGDFYDPPVGGSPAGPGVAMGQVAASDMATKDNVKADEDVQSDEVVVTARKIKEDLSRIAVGSTISSQGGWAAGFNVPCVGTIKYMEVSGNAKNMTFRLVSQSFGPGRAGENLVGSNGNSVPVIINATAAVGYGNVTNGTLYLVAHEIAHSLSVMQNYNNQLWQQYVSRSDPALTQDQLKQAYPDSPEFAANEARANSIARAIVQAIGLGAMSPDPAHGYETC